MSYQKNRLGMGPISAGASSGYVILGPNPTEEDKKSFEVENYKVTQAAAQKAGREAQNIAAAASAAARATAYRVKDFAEEKKGILIPLTIAAIVAGVVIAKKRKRKRGR
jgi:ethanolamine utilization microcompartment shell protein EutL